MQICRLFITVLMPPIRLSENSQIETMNCKARPPDKGDRVRAQGRKVFGQIRTLRLRIFCGNISPCQNGPVCRFHSLPARLLPFWTKYEIHAHLFDDFSTTGYLNGSY